MSDEQEHPRAAGRPGERRELEETGRSPFDDEHHPVEGPRSGELPVGWTDRTAQMPTVPGDDSTRVVPAADDATRVTPGVGRLDATSVMPPLDLPDAGRAEAAARAAAGRMGAEDDVWTARAQVRPPRPGQGGDFTPADWAPAPAEPRRVWWMPILVGVVVLLLLGLLGFGIWLITQGVDDEPATPATNSAAPQATVPATEPTSLRPTTTRPQTDPTTTQPSEVEIPPLVGQSSADAREALDRVGLSYRLTSRRSTAAPAGTVIDSDPPEGREVPADTEVTLVIAAAPPPSTASPTPGQGDEQGPDEQGPDEQGPDEQGPDEQGPDEREPDEN